MSLLFPDRLRVWLSPFGVALLRRHGLSRAVLSHRHRVFEGMATLDACLAEVGKLLHEEPDRLAVSILVSAHWCRTQVLPWQNTLETGDEIRAFGQSTLAKQFGLTASDWSFDTVQQGWAQPYVSCAMSRALIERCSSLCLEHNHDFTHVRPLLQSLSQSIRLPARDGISHVLIHEPGMILCAHLVDGYWHTLLHRHVDDERHDLLINAARQMLAQMPGPAARLVMVGDRLLSPTTGEALADNVVEYRSMPPKGLAQLPHAIYQSLCW